MEQARVWVCLYICMGVCVCVCMYMCVYVCVCVNKYTCASNITYHIYKATHDSSYWVSAATICHSDGPVNQSAAALIRSPFARQLSRSLIFPSSSVFLRSVSFVGTSVLHKMSCCTVGKCPSFYCMVWLVKTGLAEVVILQFLKKVSLSVGVWLTKINVYICSGWVMRLDDSCGAGWSCIDCSKFWFPQVREELCFLMLSSRVCFQP